MDSPPDEEDAGTQLMRLLGMPITSPGQLSIEELARQQGEELKRLLHVEQQISQVQHEMSQAQEQMPPIQQRMSQEPIAHGSQPQMSQVQEPVAHGSQQQTPQFQEPVAHGSRQQTPHFQEPVAHGSQQQTPQFQEPVAHGSQEQMPQFQEPVAHRSQEQMPQFQPPVAHGSQQQRPQVQEPVAHGSQQQTPQFQPPVAHGSQQQTPQFKEPVAHSSHQQMPQRDQLPPLQSGQTKRREAYWHPVSRREENWASEAPTMYDKVKKLINPLKESLNTLLATSAKIVNRTLSQHNHPGETDTEVPDPLQVQFTRAFEQFHTYCDELEFNLKTIIEMQGFGNLTEKYILPVRNHQTYKEIGPRPALSFRQFIMTVKSQIAYASFIHGALMAVVNSMTFDDPLPESQPDQEPRPGPSRS